MSTYSFFVTAPRGLTELLADELRELGARVVRTEPGGCRVRGPLSFGYRICLWSRIANRVLLHVADISAPDPDALYQGVRELPWEDHLSAEGTLAVDFVGVRAKISHSRFGMQRVKDAVVDRFRDRTGRRPSVQVRGPDLRINAFARGSGCSIAIDLSGDSLHRRGYRTERGVAPLKENLAAALLRWVEWPTMAAEGATFVDPMAGAGTLAIEAAWMAEDVAPGCLRASWGFERWLGHDTEAWRELKAEADERAEKGRAAANASIHGYDGDAEVVAHAQANAQRADAASRVEFEVRSLRRWSPGMAPQYGLLALNPPYGERLGDKADMRGLYGRLGRTLLRCFPGWRSVVLTSDDALRHAVGQVPEATMAVHNGPLRCTALRYALPTPTSDDAPPPRTSESDRAEAAPFVNRLRKNLKQRKRWANREDIGCYRLYDSDVPEFNVAIDRYEKWLHVQEFEAPERVDPEVAARRVDLVIATLPEVLGIDPGSVVLKRRRRRRGRTQYRPLAATGHRFAVTEGGHRFWVNLHDYLDTGLFLDHRVTRALIESKAAGKRFLNLFAYTGSATVYAAVGGAATTTTVDLSNTYLDWAKANLELNGIEVGGTHRLVKADVERWLRNDRQQYDLVFLDPPTTSTSKAMDDRFDVIRDHPTLIEGVMNKVAPGGELIFSTNARRFQLAAEVSQRWDVEDLTRATLPVDFRREPPIHRAWKIVHRAGS
ncbi:MAG: bifunctional 23S rRNA (guanine(2069)-N(7))-methyltransferase RlmK/23S rRNA (guanine(2445)-N(2))-methyltransferase RlmL [Myxococcota bacterium]